MTDVAPTDIEIYVKNLTRSDAEAWLTVLFGPLEAQKKRKGMPKSAFPYRAQWQGNPFSLIIFEQASADFTSLWFNTTALPWNDDQSCALKAAEYFDKPVRITAGGWENGAEPDAWREVTPDGKTEEIIWKG